ncbi:DUF3995 domain-containing protein [Loktanella sp. Alg231-35]|uniref:DUF3995 domain-containing protein n=1 Tax=Loktanella sp. Alg231-35 TaxID=1922220 RepID=UPI000D551827|nr:DUF3995 domain-containing protein [Loktanella sp. Alg231-35]
MTILLTLILMVVALLHFAWGLSIWIPIRDEEQLARTVVGAKGVTRMPGTIPCLLVVVAVLVVVAAIWMPHMAIARFVMWFALVVFLARGAIAYTKMWRAMTPEEPFNTYDQRYYAPLCVVIAIGLLVILLSA